MASYLILGRRKRDFGLVIDFHRERAIVRANTAWIEGVALEQIEAGPSGYRPGMVLVRRDWRQLYFLNERDGWTDAQYFALAATLMRQVGITKP